MLISPKSILRSNYLGSWPSGKRTLGSSDVTILALAPANVILGES